jgi:predicted SnoaL-like aldol condensation-catalyzing enzyme
MSTELEIKNTRPGGPLQSREERPADDEFVIVHGRFSGHGIAPVNWIAADILRIQDGVMVEHWDVLQAEAARSSSKSGLPMFGYKFSA